MKHALVRRLLQSTRSTALLLLSVVSAPLLAQPPADASAAFTSYVASVESRLAQQHCTPDTFLAGSDGTTLSRTDAARARQGAVIVEKLNASSPSGALIHHWRATAFAPGASPADFLRLIRNFSAYPQRFAPDVLRTTQLVSNSDLTRIRMRVRQHHVITVVLDGTYDVSFNTLDAQHGSSISRSIRMDEIASPDSPKEHALSPEDEHGFLWRQNTYWSYEQRDGGLYLQLESVSLTRAIPHGLGWAVRPFVESIPRESLEFTLRSACNALRKPGSPKGNA